MNQNEPFYGLTPFRQILWSSAFRRLRLNRSAQSPKPRLNHTQSNRIKPNQTKSNDFFSCANTINSPQPVATQVHLLWISAFCLLPSAFCFVLGSAMW